MAYVGGGRESAAALLACGLGKTSRGDWLCATCEYQNKQQDAVCRNTQCPTRSADFSVKTLPQDLAGLFEPRGKGLVACKSCDMVYRANDLWGMRAHWYFSQGRNRFYCRRSGEMIVKSEECYVNESRRSTMMQRSRTLGDLTAGRNGSITSLFHRQPRLSATAQALLAAATRPQQSDTSSEEGEEKNDSTRMAVVSRQQLKRPSRWTHLLGGDKPTSGSSRSRSGRGSPSRTRRIERRESARAVTLDAEAAKRHGLQQIDKADPQALRNLDRAIKMFTSTL